MNVLIVTNMYPGRDPDMTYAGIFVKEQVDALEQRGASCTVHVIDGFRSKLNYLVSAFSIAWHVARNPYDIIHIHYGLSGLFLLLNPFKRRWRNVVLTLHGGDILRAQGKRFQVALTKLVAQKAEVVITLNDEMDEALVGRVVSPVRLPCGADGSLFKGSYSVRDKVVIIFPGSKTRRVKNYPLFQSAFSEYFKRNHRAEAVALDGYSREEVAELLRGGSLLLMTSRSEGSPQIIKEAMLSDLAVISTDVGDVAEVLGGTPGTAVLSEGASGADIAQVIEGTMAAAAATPGARRRRIFELELEQSQVVSKLLRVYGSVCK